MSSANSWPAGFLVGHWTDAEAGTGCTVVLPPDGTLGAVDIRGGGPSTRETELLAAEAPLAHVTGLLLTGGSAFGLNAAAGVVRWCEEHHRGYDVGIARIPIVPAAVIFDLGVSGNLRRPEADDAYQACCDAVARPPAMGSVGAGTGATVGKLLGVDGRCKGGFGVACATTIGGARVAVLVVVNAFGDILDASGQILAGAWSPNDGFVDARRAGIEVVPDHPRLGEHTTLCAVLTDAQLTKPEAVQVSRMVSAGLGRVVAPVHTPLDGDVVFTLASGTVRSSAFTVGVVGARLVEEAIRAAIRSAVAVRGVVTAEERRSHRAT